MNTCSFTYVTLRTLLPCRATGLERSWEYLKREFNRQGEGLPDPSAKYFETITCGPQLFAVTGSSSVFYHDQGQWCKYKSAYDIEHGTISIPQWTRLSLSLFRSVSSEDSMLILVSFFFAWCRVSHVVCWSSSSEWVEGKEEVWLTLFLNIRSVGCSEVWPAIWSRRSFRNCSSVTSMLFMSIWTIARSWFDSFAMLTACSRWRTIRKRRKWENISKPFECSTPPEKLEWNTSFSVSFPTSTFPQLRTSNTIFANAFLPAHLPLSLSFAWAIITRICSPSSAARGRRALFVIRSSRASRFRSTTFATPVKWSANCSKNRKDGPMDQWCRSWRNFWAWKRSVGSSKLKRAERSSALLFLLNKPSRNSTGISSRLSVGTVHSAVSTLDKWRSAEKCRRSWGNSSIGSERRIACSNKHFVWKELDRRDSSVGRASDWRSEGPWFDPGSRHLFSFFLLLLLLVRIKIDWQMISSRCRDDHRERERTLDPWLRARKMRWSTRHSEEGQTAIFQSNRRRISLRLERMTPMQMLTRSSVFSMDSVSDLRGVCVVIWARNVVLQWSSSVAWPSPFPTPLSLEKKRSWSNTWLKSVDVQLTRRTRKRSVRRSTSRISTGCRSFGWPFVFSISFVIGIECLSRRVSSVESPRSICSWWTRTNAASRICWLFQADRIPWTSFPLVRARRNCRWRSLGMFTRVVTLWTPARNLDFERTFVIARTASCNMSSATTTTIIPQQVVSTLGWELEVRGEGSGQMHISDWI